MNNYFRKAIEIKKQLKLDPLIFNGEQKQFFRFKNLEFKIQLNLGIQYFFIECKFVDGVQYLISISICLDLQYNPMDCHRMIRKCNRNTEIIIQDWHSF